MVSYLLPVAYAVDIVGVLMAAGPGSEVLVCGLVVGGEVRVQPAQAAHKPAPAHTLQAQGCCLQDASSIAPMVVTTGLA